MFLSPRASPPVFGILACHRAVAHDDESACGRVNPATRRGAEYLPGMPCNVLSCGFPEALLRKTYRAVVIVQEPAYRRARSVNLSRHYEPVACPLRGPLQSDCSAIESAMMKGTQRQPVGNAIGAAVGVPLDVRGFQSQQVILQAQIEVADRTTALVSGQNRLAEARVAETPGRPPLLLGGAQQPYGLQDVLVHGNGGNVHPGACGPRAGHWPGPLPATDTAAPGDRPRCRDRASASCSRTRLRALPRARRWPDTGTGIPDDTHGAAGRSVAADRSAALRSRGRTRGAPLRVPPVPWQAAAAGGLWGARSSPRFQTLSSSSLCCSVSRVIREPFLTVGVVGVLERGTEVQLPRPDRPPRERIDPHQSVAGAATGRCRCTPRRPR